jgi:hypothetical protein
LGRLLHHGRISHLEKDRILASLLVGQLPIELVFQLVFQHMELDLWMLERVFEMVIDYKVSMIELGELEASWVFELGSQSCFDTVPVAVQVVQPVLADFVVVLTEIHSWAVSAIEFEAGAVVPPI